MNQRAFAIGAHPDDIEFGMAGTLILLKRAGFEIHYMNVATGSCGSMEWDAARTERVRLEEAKRAAVRIGAAFHPPLVPDIEIFYEKGLLARLGSVVREVAPSILLVPSPEDYMEDHTNTARLAVSAAFCRNMSNFPVDPPRAAVAGEVTVYHAQPYWNRDGLNRVVLPGLFVDVTGVLEEKVAMLAEHRSQKEWLDRSQGIDAYLTALRESTRETGELSGRFEYAEGWRRHNPLGFCAATADPLSDALGELVCGDAAGDRSSVIGDR